ncbi:hypothetical protein, partial [Brasilonema sp. UFV-L1]|uniref:hypothetical protein n=1 Tax=Brasilonema sp. UFV-L1 TaxID=2234130 RepID=UPI0016A270DE
MVAIGGDVPCISFSEDYIFLFGFSRFAGTDTLTWFGDCDVYKLEQQSNRKREDGEVGEVGE